jgi:CheY-like chemotaxis protein
MSEDATIRRTILLVDDHEQIRSKFRELFESYGFYIVEASNGREAIDALSAELHPNLIVMDLQMPVMDGLTAVRQIRRMKCQCRQIPIFAISAGGAEMMELALDAGCNVFFTKTQTNELITAIEQKI